MTIRGRSAIAISTVLLVGCDPTTALVPIEQNGGPAPSALRLSVYNRYGALVLDHPLTPARLPGAVMLELPAIDQIIRVAVDGDPGLIGGTQFPATAHARVDVPKIVIAPVGSDPDHLDSDRDGVPDVIDNCPYVANHDQADARGDGIGDACANPSLDGAGDLSDAAVLVDAGDFAIGDLASTDLAGDLAVARDFATNADLAGNPSLCPGTFALCDGFEGSSIDTNNWPAALMVMQGGNVSIDTTRAYRGAHSLRMHVDASSGTQPVVVVMENRVLTTPLYARAFFNVSSAAPTSSTLHISILRAEDTTSHELDVSPVVDHFAFGTTMPPGFYGESVGSTFTADQWFCVEMEVPTAGGPHPRLWINGNDITPANAVTVNQSSLMEVAFGVLFPGTATAGAFDVWLDEVAIDSSPIGCTR
jgi:hypothetical protein